MSTETTLTCACGTACFAAALVNQKRQEFRSNDTHTLLLTCQSCFAQLVFPTQLVQSPVEV